MCPLENISIVLPSLNPDGKLLSVIDGLLSAGFGDIILVNDGSDPSHLRYFEEASRHPQVHLLHHSKNRGKGAALKTAFRWFLEHRPQGIGVVTVDGDNQHRPEDTAACALRMKETKQVILGCRDFSVPGVPQRSLKGNRLTSAVFKIFCGMTLSDTQTGLRAIPTPFLESLCAVKGDRFEYETRMLLALRQENIPYGEVPIQTVYIEENESSHFRVVRDSVRIYASILSHFFRYTLASVLSAVVDTGVFSLLSMLLSGILSGLLFNAVCTGGARLTSSLLNFFMNKRLVFRSGTGTVRALLRYYCLAIPMLLLQLGLTHGTYLLFHIEDHRTLLRTLIYVAVMSVLYILSFMFQQRWVFRSNSNAKD